MRGANPDVRKRDTAASRLLGTRRVAGTVVIQVQFDGPIVEQVFALCRLTNTVAVEIVEHVDNHRHGPDVCEVHHLIQIAPHGVFDGQDGPYLKELRSRDHLVDCEFRRGSGRGSRTDLEDIVGGGRLQGLLAVRLRSREVDVDSERTG